MWCKTSDAKYIWDGCITVSHQYQGLLYQYIIRQVYDHFAVIVCRASRSGTRPFWMTRQCSVTFRLTGSCGQLLFCRAVAFSQFLIQGGSADMHYFVSVWDRADKGVFLQSSFIALVGQCGVLYKWAAQGHSDFFCSSAIFAQLF